MNMPNMTPAPSAPQKNNTPIIIGVVVLVVLCLCCVLAGGAYYLYQNGDQIFHTGSSGWQILHSIL
jgi:hypothetical protein